jgi:uncharacterized protein YuzE
MIRWQQGKVYTFQQTRYSRYYEQRRVEVFYIIERETISTVIVYVFCGKWWERMQILYDGKTDLLCCRLDERKQQVINKRLSGDIVLDIGEDDKIVRIEILDASKQLDLEKVITIAV